MGGKTDFAATTPIHGPETTKYTKATKEGPPKALRVDLWAADCRKHGSCFLFVRFVTFVVQSGFERS